MENHFKRYVYNKRYKIFSQRYLLAAWLMEKWANKRKCFTPTNPILFTVCYSFVQIDSNSVERNLQRNKWQKQNGAILLHTRNVWLWAVALHAVQV